MGSSVTMAAALEWWRGRGREQVLRGERTTSDKGGLIIGVGKELASDVLRRLLDDI